MAWVVGVVVVVGSNWFDGLCVCGSIDGLMICVYVCVCVWLCACGDGFGQVDRCIMDLCVALCVEPVLEVEGEREEKKKDC